MGFHSATTHKCLRTVLPFSCVFDCYYAIIEMKTEPPATNSEGSANSNHTQ